MRLTKAMRDTFVRAVMLDVPKVDYQDQLRKRVLEMTRAAFPPALVRAQQQFPSWFHYVNIHITRTIDGTNQTVVGVNFPFSSSGSHYNELRSEVLADEEVCRLANAYVAQANARITTEKELRALALSCTTCEQLVGVAPQLASYLPEPEAKSTPNLPVATHVLHRLSAQGFPMTKGSH